MLLYISLAVLKQSLVGLRLIQPRLDGQQASGICLSTALGLEAHATIPTFLVWGF